MVLAVQNAIASKILDSACALFADKGFEATSTREICERAGVTKPMLYYYFGNKEGLFRAVLDHFLGEFHARVLSAMETPGSARERLIEFLWAHFDVCGRRTDFARLFFAIYFAPGEPPIARLLEENIKKFEQLLERLVREVAREGLTQAGREEGLALALRGMINISVISAMKQKLKLTRPMAERIVDDLLNGFGRTEVKTKRPLRTKKKSARGVRKK